jgi:hypothetical protein
MYPFSSNSNERGIVLDIHPSFVFLFDDRGTFVFAAAVINPRTVRGDATFSSGLRHRSSEIK